eukprot:TRINITY_DN80021_c0_g1_i1.p1 TRINITY_DN80021_c0_g1~~TRINITY_DN80021_c0_g1_i1.p1  ORF type:complete len:102 (-),score=4.75 TRINITY_DN80021_c0_g1_i1:10-315(-)
MKSIQGGSSSSSSSSSSQSFPNLQNLEVWDGILEKGDVLYIPPMWFHQVSALEFSVSVSVWTPDSSSEQYFKLTDDPLPIKEIGRAVQQECRDRSRMPSSA